MSTSYEELEKEYEKNRQISNDATIDNIDTMVCSIDSALLRIENLLTQMLELMKR